MGALAAAARTRGAEKNKRSDRGFVVSHAAYGAHGGSSSACCSTSPTTYYITYPHDK